MTRIWQPVAVILAIPILLCGQAVLRGEPFTAWVAVNVASYPLILVASIALHEGGHALAALALGLKVPRVQLGTGRPVKKWRWGRTAVTLHALPLVGLTHFGGQPSRWRYWAAIAAGPVATFAIVAAIVMNHGWRGLDDVFAAGAAIASRPCPLELAAVANAWLLAVNLVPLPRFLRGMVGRNDGHQLLTVPFWPARNLEMLEIAPGLLEADELREKGALDAAAGILLDLEGRFPGSWAVLNSAAVLQLARGRFVEARASFLTLLESEAPQAELRWIAGNNLAWTDFLLRDDSLRAEADEHSRAAHRHYREAAWALMTRGAVLGWLARPDEAIPLLKSAYRLNTTSGGRSMSGAILALLLARQGRVGEAAVWLERARSSQAACRFIPEAAAAIDAAGGQSG